VRTALVHAANKQKRVGLTALKTCEEPGCYCYSGELGSGR